MNEIPYDLADLSVKTLRKWKDLDLIIKLNLCIFLFFSKNWKNFVKILISLMISKEISQNKEIFSVKLL